MEKQDIKSMTQEELRAFLVSLGEKPFRTAQIYQWMHEKLASSFDDMTNLSKVLRQKLQDACEYVSLEKVRGADFADRWNPQVPVPPRGRQCHRECPDAL